MKLSEYSGNNSRFVNSLPMDLTTPEVAIKELYEWYKHSNKI